MRQTISSLLFFFVSSSFSQNISGEELLQKAIEYHDPTNQWSDFYATLEITLETPEKSNRYSRVSIDNLSNNFRLEEKRGNRIIKRAIKSDECSISMNNKTEFSSEEVTKYHLTCERSLFMRDYYTYLYGLPMKLKDKGTIIDPVVLLKTFKGKDYLVLKVTYEKSVGNDTWFFYFNPTSYAMEIYQFFHDETKNDGEYILLKDISKINNMKLPKVRQWYVNKDNKYLGTDILTKFSEFDYHEQN
ncbi:MAG: DUF6503 family protein [Cyclobacteriaceae bacterium]|nr:DUF6503 family protein [Cyclobacteriaceae bacterium]